jgi:hypothetical protein
MSSGAFGVETSGSMGVVIGVIVGVIIAFAPALVIMHRRRREMRRKKAHEPPPLQRPPTEAHEPQPAVATAAPELNPELNPAAPAKRPNTLEISPAEPSVETQSALVPMLPDLKLRIAMAAPNPTVGQRHAVGSSVYVKRSNGEETLAYVKEYDVEKALYTVELEKVGSGKAKTYRDKDLRASKNMLEELLYSVRATLFTLQAAQEPEPAEKAAQAAEAARAAAEEAAQAEAACVAAEEAAQAAEAARAAAEEAAQAEAASGAAEEAAQAAEADRVQVLEPTVPPTAVRMVDELRNRRSTFIFPHNAVPATTFTNVKDVTRGQKVVGGESTRTYVATNPLAFSSPGPALAGFEREMAQYDESAPSTSRRTHALTGPALARNEDMATLGTTLGATFGAMNLAAGAEEPDPSSPIISTIFGMFSPKPAEVRSFSQYV